MPMVPANSFPPGYGNYQDGYGNYPQGTQGPQQNVVLKEATTPDGRVTIQVVLPETRQRIDSEREDDGFRGVFQKAIRLQKQAADTPLQQLIIVPANGFYLITGCLVIDTTDTGGGTLTFTIQTTQVAPTGTTTETVGPVAQNAITINPMSELYQYLMAGTPILFGCVGGTYAAGGTYDLSVCVTLV